jgi:hypothetical protein
VLLGGKGKDSDYLSMKLDFSIPGQVKVSMFEYVKGIIDAFVTIGCNALTGRKVGTTAPDDLFKVNSALKTSVTDSAQLKELKEQQDDNDSVVSGLCWEPPCVMQFSRASLMT